MTDATMMEPSTGDAAAAQRVNELLANNTRRVKAKPSTDQAAPSWAVPQPIGDGEWQSAKLTPRCIVDDYLFADVGVLIAPGSTGKTTMSLHEAVCIALGRPLWGLEVRTPGPVLIVTAEDQRERLTARLREVCSGMGLSAANTDRVRKLVRIDDQTVDLRRLTAVVADVVVVSDFPRAIVDGCRADNFAPVLVQFDPLVSFGVGESRVNDAEQALIQAGRLIVGELNCAVRYVHHTGAQKAIDKTTHQYSGRGGSALPDGSRMVHVLAAMNDAELTKATGEHLSADEKQSAFVLARPKVSHAPPNLPPIYVRRSGFQFESLRAIEATPEAERVARIADQLARFIEAEHLGGAVHSRATLEQVRPDNLSRADVRAGLAWLEARGRIWEEAVLTADGKAAERGRRKGLRAAFGDPTASPTLGEPTARRAA